MIRSRACLRSVAGGGPSPDLDAISLRAHRIRRRRQTGLAGAGAAAMAVVAVVGVLLATGPGGEKATTLVAEDVLTTSAPRALGVAVATPAPDPERRQTLRPERPIGRSARRRSTGAGDGAALGR